MYDRNLCRTRFQLILSRKQIIIPRTRKYNDRTKAK